MSAAQSVPSPGVYIGRRARPIDWEARTLGAASYVGDTVPADALQGVILRSPHPYALIEAIDVSEAAAMPGVRAVITSEHFPKGARYAAYESHDRPPLADGVVRFIGEEVAAVAADTMEQARAAVAKIRVKYRRLRAPLKLGEALDSQAPILHAPPAPAPAPEGAAAEAPSPAPEPASGPAPDRNVRCAFRRQWGDVEAGNAQALESVSARYRYPQQNQCCMETHRALAQWTEDGRLHLWTPTATPMVLKYMLLPLFYLDPSRVVVHEVAVGGSFGAKLSINGHEALAAALAREAKRPVVITLSREEEFETNYTRHAFDVDLTLRADAAGALRSFEGLVDVDNGAYLNCGMSVVGAAVTAFGSAYKVDGIDVAARLIDTCKVPGGAMRGYGGPQTTFARESLVDEMALRLGRDPIDLRIQNAYGQDTETLVGHVGSNGLVDCLHRVREAIDWERERAHPRRGQGRGVGVATGEHPSGAHTFPGSNRTDGAIDLYADGRLRVRSGCADVGTGQRTMLAQVAAQELGVPLDRIEVLSMDTDQTPMDWGGWGSRGTHYSAHAMGLTARKFADKLKGLAAQRLGGVAMERAQVGNLQTVRQAGRKVESRDIRLEDGFARSEFGEIPLGELVALSDEAKDGVLSHGEIFVDQNVEMFGADGRGNFTATHNFAAHGAVVEVDPKTGKLRIVDYVSASDSGTVMNPLLMEGQVRGAVAMGMGGALGEELIFEQGKLVNPAFLHYALPRAADLPGIRVIHAGIPDDKGPYGAKGAGELGVNPVAPAVANAVYDAVGVRVRSLPITPDKIVEGLARQQGRRRRFHLWRRPGRWHDVVVRALYPLGLFQTLHWWQTRKQRTPAPPAPALQAIESPSTPAEAAARLGADAAVLGGGTDLQLRRRQNLFAPARLVSVARMAELRQLSVPAPGDEGDIVVGAAVTLSDLAEAVRARIPALAHAIDEIASPQIRNVATVAGNLLQAKRCWFFRNGFNCYKRRGADAPCYSVLGDHRFYHAAIDGHRCQAVTPSDLATVLVALDAVATIAGPQGRRELPVEKLYTGPGESCLGEHDMVVRVVIPQAAATRSSSFRKLNLWQGDFAVASAALSLRLDAAGHCAEARLCLGAVAPVPMRARRTERELLGKTPTPELLRALLDHELDARAHPLERNEWKLDAVAGLAERVLEDIVR